MSSRDDILSAVARNKPAIEATYNNDLLFQAGGDLEDQFAENVIFNGGTIRFINSINEISSFVHNNFRNLNRIVTNIDGLRNATALPIEEHIAEKKPHNLENVDLVILKSHFGVAENGAIWLTEGLIGQRVLPFITQHLILIIEQQNILPSLYNAYQVIEKQDYGYGVFIAGPSKTADIEQSLVTGAHGARSLNVFVLKSNDHAPN